MEIGIPDKQYKLIEWYDWKVDPKSIEIDDVEVEDFTIKQLIPTLMPNVCIRVCDKQTEVLSLPIGGNIHVHFDIKLYRKQTKNDSNQL